MIPNDLNVIRLTRLVKLIVDKPWPIINITNIPGNKPLAPIGTPHHLLVTSRTRNLSLQLRRLKLTITANTKPCNNMKTLQTNPDRSVVKLVPRRFENGFTLVKNLNKIPIFFILPNLSTLKTRAITTIAKLMNTIATNIKTTFNKLKTMTMRCPNQHARTRTAITRITKDKDGLRPPHQPKDHVFSRIPPLHKTQTPEYSSP
jgi:hypothetical protein